MGSRVHEINSRAFYILLEYIRVHDLYRLQVWPQLVTGVMSLTGLVPILEHQERSWEFLAQHKLVKKTVQCPTGNN